MSRTTISFLAIVFLSTGLVLPATAQKIKEDVRPLAGLDRTVIPRYSSVEEFLRSHPPADLTAAATPVVRERLTSPAMKIRHAMTPLLQSGQPVSRSVLRMERAKNGTIRWMTGALGRTERASAGKVTSIEVAEVALAIVDTYAGLLLLNDPAAELRLLQAETDDIGYRHARFQQTYQNVPVWGRDLFVHFDDTGAVYAINGTYEPTPSVLSMVPSVADDSALRIVQEDLRARERWAPLSDEAARWLGISDPAVQLVVYPEERGGMRLAYEISLHPNLLEWYTYLVDAHDGRVLNRIERHCTLWHEAPRLRNAPTVSGLPRSTGASKTGSAGTFFDATAADLSGQSQSFRVYQDDAGSFFKLWDLPNLNAAQSTLPNEPAGGALTISANNTDFNESVNLTHITSNNNTWIDPAGVSAHVSMEATFSYYKNTHNRDAIDGNNQSIISVVHVTDGGQPMDNAFWNGRVMAYGDGAQFFTPLAGSRDVAGHEMTHGVIQHSADLIYQFQSGALNESFADVFGVMVDREDFLLGEDIVRQGIALRDLLNPDNPQVLSRQPAHMRDFRNLDASQDNGGVHVNSGIPNRAAALIIQDLGHSAAERIYYRALTVYLTRNSQFGDARNAVRQSAEDLFGASSDAVAAVEQAFDAVGIFGTSGTGGDGSNDVPAQADGASLITFMTEDGSIGILDVTDFNNLEANLIGDAGAKVRITDGDRAQLTTAKDGERIWFINQQNQLAFVTVETEEVSVLNTVFLEQPGDLWNASVSPDEDFVALVSAYTNDPTLYIFDGSNIGAIDLLPETTQNGIENNTIQYPDVVSWSPNPQVPRIAFDAFSEVPFGPSGSTIAYWSIYELDFDAERIYNLIPAQTTDINVGNITYSNTDPDLIAFNKIDAQGTFDVFIGDFETGSFESLDIPSFALDGMPIRDAERPTFSPDDNLLCFTSPSLGVMLFADGERAPSFVDFQQPIYNARWFVRGGTGGSQNQAPTAQFSISTTSGTAPLLVGVDATASSDPEGEDLSYRWEFGDGSVGSGVTTAHTYAAGGTYTLQLTVMDSGGLSGTVSAQVEVSDANVSVEDEAGIPTTYALAANYPNPFTSATTFAYDVPELATVRLSVFDLYGREVATLVDATQPPGHHEVLFEAGSLASGVYFYRLEANTFSATRRLVLTK